MTRVIAGAGPFDLDDLCAEIPETLGAPWPGENPTEVKHSYTFKRFRHKLLLATHFRAARMVSQFPRLFYTLAG